MANRVAVTHYTPQSIDAVFAICWSITGCIGARIARPGETDIFAYFFGISLMMITAIILSTFARDFFIKYLRKIVPRMDIVTGVLLLLAGGYVIYYQMILI